MNLKQMRYFCETVEAGGATHAAGRLFVAPTAISMQLAQLEQQLGGELFDRSRRPMELTSLGRYFYPRAKELLVQAKRLDEEARGIAGGKRGWLGIGFVRSTLFSVLPVAIRTFRKSFPDVHLDFVEVLSEYQPELLRQGRIDIGIARFIGKLDLPADLRYAVMVNEPFVAAVPIGHPFAKRRSLRAAELTTLPFILYPKDPKSPFGLQMLSLLQAAGGVAPVVGHQAIEIHTALALVGSGLGATIVGESIAMNNRSDVKFVPLRDVEAKTTLLAVVRKNEDSKIVDAFTDFFHRAC